MKKNREYLILLIMVVMMISGTFFIEGCSKNKNEVGNPPPSEPPEDEIWISNNSFVPSNRLVQLHGLEPGQVTWRNMDQTDHRIVSGTTANPDTLFDSGNIPPQGTFHHTYSVPGIYHYHCSIHNKDGTVTVQ